jgi:hypothetical protein
MLEQLRRTYREIAATPAGKRFRCFHQRRRERGGRWQAVAMVGAGLVLVAVGLLLSLPPLMPGFLLWVPGLALIASQLRSVAHLLDRTECLLRGLYRRVAGVRESR